MCVCVREVLCSHGCHLSLQSRHSWHALPPARGPSLLEDSFNHAPGSRVISPSHYASDYEALSQESGDDGRVSVPRQPRHATQEHREPQAPPPPPPHHHHHPHDQLSSAFDFNERGMPPPPMIGGYSAYNDPRGQRSSLPYPGPHPPQPNQSRERDEFLPHLVHHLWMSGIEWVLGQGWALDMVEWDQDLVEWGLDVVEWGLDLVEWGLRVHIGTHSTMDHCVLDRI